ncbi:hypothetical protein ACIF70_19060 [Actinacidiphila glaucinigra]|uniref:hypothetical protein n=1 Tax=Actinacidiphila glaucinigra TaxID=235986 RepID=UPI0037C5DECD
MLNEAVSAGELGFLLGLVDPESAARARSRTGVPEVDPAAAAKPPEHVPWGPWWHGLPVSVLWWMLQEDDPRVNTLVYHHWRADDRMRYDIINGVPYGPDRSRRLKVPADLSHYPAPELALPSGPEALTAVLRAVTGMSQGRAAALLVGREDWAAVAGADREQPLPGYARWALAIRPDCPPALRTQFGTHRKFTNRLRDAGVVDGPAVYATGTRPARDVLRVLAMGHWAFPLRLAEAAEALRPLVRAELGGNTEAWAVLTQLLPTFTGTLPELATTAGAIAGSAGETAEGPLSVASGNTESPGRPEESGHEIGGRTWDSTSGHDDPWSTSPTDGRWSAGVRRIRTSWRRRSG